MAQDIIFGKTRANWSRSSSLSGMGSVILSAKEQARLLNKVDDVRYDLRKVSGRVAISVSLLAASIGMFAIASIFRTSRTPPR
jgi:hypothetical protein